MKRIFFILCLFLNGCHLLKPKSYDASQGDYVLSGVTATDYQIIEPIRCVDSVITVKIKTPDAVDYRELNRYEYQPITKGTGGGGVRLGKKVLIVGNRLKIINEPAAPTGSLYEIHSTLIVNAKELY